MSLFSSDSETKNVPPATQLQRSARTRLAIVNVHNTEILISGVEHQKEEQPPEVRALSYTASWASDGLSPSLRCTPAFHTSWFVVAV